MKPTERLRRVIKEAYDNYDDLRVLTSDVLDVRLEDVAPNGRMPVVVHDLLKWCETEGRLIEFVLGAQERKPGNPDLVAVTSALRGVESSSWMPRAAARQQFEKIVLRDVSFENVGPWLERLKGLLSVVCRFEPQPPNESLEGFGTGFLVAPDTVMTSFHVIEPLRGTNVDQVRVRFDCALAADGVTAAAGRTVSLAAKWDVLHSPTDELDFALVRLAAQVGRDVANGAERGHLRLTVHRFTPGEPLLILQHPEARPLQLSLGSVLEPEIPPSHVSYNANTECGSSGSPCFTSALDAVAIHRSGEEDNDNRGVRFDAIVGFLQRHHAELVDEGLGHLVPSPGPPPSPSLGRPPSPSLGRPASPSPGRPPSPSPGPPPSPSPEHPPSPSPEPPPSPSPEPPPSPSRGPAPEASRGPAPEASPGPAPEASRGSAPEASRGPAPEASRGPAPEPSRGPAPEASPGPAPEPSRGPAPEASPGPAPEASRGPAPEAWPGHPPSPSPEPPLNPSPIRPPSEERRPPTILVLVGLITVIATVGVLALLRKPVFVSVYLDGGIDAIPRPPIDAPERVVDATVDAATVDAATGARVRRIDAAVDASDPLIDARPDAQMKHWYCCEGGTPFMILVYGKDAGVVTNRDYCDIDAPADGKVQKVTDGKVASCR